MTNVLCKGVLRGAQQSANLRNYGNMPKMLTYFSQHHQVRSDVSVMSNIQRYNICSKGVSNRVDRSLM